MFDPNKPIAKKSIKHLYPLVVHIIDSYKGEHKEFYTRDKKTIKVIYNWIFGIKKFSTQALRSWTFGLTTNSKKKIIWKDDTFTANQKPMDFNAEADAREGKEIPKVIESFFGEGANKNWLKDVHDYLEKVAKTHLN